MSLSDYDYPASLFLLNLFPSQQALVCVTRELELFQNYFFYERLELWDWQLDGRIFFMPRFVRNLSENGKEILSMKVLQASATDPYRY